MPGPDASRHSFFFAFLDGKSVLTARAVHIRRLYDILLLCLQSGELQRACKAYAILLRSREVDWKELWKLGAFLLCKSGGVGGVGGRDVEFLRIMLLQHPNNVSQFYLVPAGNKLADIFCLARSHYAGANTHLGQV
jgi:hypothetical protein